ncbi:MAG: hypothetical protein HQ527_11075 [Cyanobacteria bacterium]|nr:hypothetical protein [Cyanobacteria bacterium bin.51]
MPDDDKLIESIKFLLKSVKQLSDRFVESDAKLNQGFEAVSAEVSDLQKRIKAMEESLVEFSDQSLLRQRPIQAPELPVRRETTDRTVPSINLPTDTVIEIYGSTPVLLEPFSRPCSVSARTLSGEIDEVELEIFAQGTTWALETLDGGWILLPKQGSLQRRTQVQTLERFYEIDGVKEIPATLHLIEPASGLAVEYGRRWKLKKKDRLSIHPDPHHQGKVQRLMVLEQRLSRVETRETTESKESI